MKRIFGDRVFIYKITNKINGKMYVGQTINSISKRWSKHKRDSKCTAISNAIKKYGEENFSIEEIDKANDIEELNKKECDYISNFNSISPNGYNLKPGGGGKLPCKETLKRMSDSHKGNKHSSESKKAISKAIKEKYKDLKYKEKRDNELRKALKKPKYLKKLSKRIKKQWASEEYRNEWNDKYNDIGFRNKISKSHGGRSFSVFKITEYFGNTRGGNFKILKKEYVGQWVNQKICAETLELNDKNINACLKNRQKTHKLYIFEYNDE